MTSMLIWGVATVLYILFLSRYYNWSGAIKAEEVEGIIQKLSASTGMQYTDVDTFRTFLEQDDGKEFIMQNFVKLRRGEVVHPSTGQPISPRKLLNEYFRPFVKELIKRGGHPLSMSAKVGGYIDSWEAEEDPAWDAVAMMRYRCRRDIAELVMDGRFSEIHGFKHLAIEKTVSFPVQMNTQLIMKPGVYVPIMLLLLASLGQIATGFV